LVLLAVLSINIPILVMLLAILSISILLPIILIQSHFRMAVSSAALPQVSKVWNQCAHHPNDQEAQEL
jgi:hypothetical protein